MAQTRTLDRPRIGPLAVPRIGTAAVVLLAVVVAASAYYAACSLLIHYSFYSHGWDLGVFDQVIWNLSEGRGWDYSFRETSYIGDHLQPILLALVPLAWLDAGPAPLLVVQGVALAAAAVPLFAATRRLAEERAAWLLAGAYLLSLPVLRTVSFDFHPEAFIPLFAFTSFWGLVSGQRLAFAGGCLALLTVKEDAALVVLALCWLSWVAFEERRVAAAVGAIAVIHAAVVSIFVIPHYLGDATNPMLDRYGYLGDSAEEIIFSAFTRPDLLAEQLARWDALGAALLLLAGVAFLPLAGPRLLPPLAVLMAVPMLAEHPEQSVMDLHYGIAPMTYAFCAAALVMPEVTAWLRERADHLRGRPIPWAAAPLAAGVVIFVLASPLPPSIATDFGQFYPGHHSAVGRSFLDDIPNDARVSAQATFVPHLVRRKDMYEFPRVVNAEYVILDDKRPVPGYDEPGFARCERELAGLGFRLAREEDGIRLYERSVTPSPGEGSACD